MTRCIIALLFFVFSAQLFAFEHESAIFAPLSSTDHALSQQRFNIDPKINPSWLHQIKAINRKTSTITLEDGSEWTLGYWYSSILKNWNIGDQVTVSWYMDTYFLDTQIKNYTKESYAWCQIKETPQPNASGFLFVERVINKMSIVLNNGTRIRSTKPLTFSNFKEGDVVITLYGKGTGTQSLYSLWDVVSQYVAYDLIIDTPIDTQ